MAWLLTNQKILHKQYLKKDIHKLYLYVFMYNIKSWIWNGESKIVKTNTLLLVWHGEYLAVLVQVGWGTAVASVCLWFLVEVQLQNTN